MTARERLAGAIAVNEERAKLYGEWLRDARALLALVEAVGEAAPALDCAMGLLEGAEVYHAQLDAITIAYRALSGGEGGA